MKTLHTPWEENLMAFRVIGNLYFIGNAGASLHIVDTGDGLILFDTGYQHTLYLVIDCMYQLGLNPHNIKKIFLTHGHIDHIGGARALKELTGASIALGEEDVPYANGTLDLTFAKELDMVFYETFDPDIAVRDGDRFTLGNTTVCASAMPGHTPGAMTYYFNVTDGDRIYKAALHGGSGMNTFGKAFLDKYGLPYTLRDRFIAAVNQQKAEQVDIFLGNHCTQNDTAGKYKRLLAGDKTAFVDPKEWSVFSDRIIKNLQDLIAKEQ